MIVCAWETECGATRRLNLSAIERDLGNSVRCATKVASRDITSITASSRCTKVELQPLKRNVNVKYLYCISEHRERNFSFGYIVLPVHIMIIDKTIHP